MKYKRLKICYIANPDSIHTEKWLRYFVNQMHEVHLIPVRNYNVRIPGVIYHNLEGKFKSIPILWIIEKIIKARRLIKKLSPDIIHGHYIPGCGIFAYLCGFKPLVVTAWGGINIYSKFSFMKKILIRRTVQSANLITVVSHELENRIVNLGASRENIYMIQFGVDVKLFHPGYDVSTLKKKLKIEDNEKIIFSPRMIRPVYNTDNVIKAFKLLQRDFTNLRLILKLYLEGDKDTGYIKYIKRLVKELGIENRVIFIEQVKYSTMPRLYNLSDVIVSVANNDGSPVSVLEAMACGCNIVASNIPALQEWIKDDWNGYLVKVKDIEDIYQKIKKSLLIKSDKHEKFINRNINIVKKRAEYFSNMKKMERLYYKLSKKILNNFITRIIKQGI